MSDKLPSFGVKPRDTSKPKRMLYQQPSWTLPSCGSNISELQYDLAVGRITQEQFDAGRTKKELDRRELETAMLVPSIERR